jgi:hypothetical protein
MNMVHGFCRMTTYQQRARAQFSDHGISSAQLTGQDYSASKSEKPSTCKLRAGQIFAVG